MDRKTIQSPDEKKREKKKKRPNRGLVGLSRFVIVFSMSFKSKR